MGVDLGDVDGDGRLDIFVSNFEFEPNALYRNLRPGVFADARFVANLARASIAKLAFGVDLADYDHDGDLDVLVGNGHILDNAAEFDSRSSYAQPTQLFENDGRGRFRGVDSFGIDGDRVARGLATGDLDHDGDLDVVIVISNGRAEVYENIGAAPRSWLLLALRAVAGDRVTVGVRAAADGRRRSSGAREPHRLLVPVPERRPPPLGAWRSRARSKRSICAGRAAAEYATSSCPRDG